LGRSDRLRKKIAGRKGIILINCSLLVEANMLHICNNNVLLIEADKKTQTRRLLKRNLTGEQIKTRLNCQYNNHDKKIAINNEINKHRHGKLWIINNSKNLSKEKIWRYFGEMIGELCVWV